MPWSKSSICLKHKDSSASAAYWVQSPLRLPFSKFGLNERVVWGSLHEKYNTAPIFLMDKVAWHTDLLELMRNSDTLEELHEALEERRKQRLKELTEGIQSMEWDIGFSHLRSESLHKVANSVRALLGEASVYNAMKLFRTMADVERTEDKMGSREENEDWERWQNAARESQAKLRARRVAAEAASEARRKAVRARRKARRAAAEAIDGAAPGETRDEARRVESESNGKARVNGESRSTGTTSDDGPPAQSRCTPPPSQVHPSPCGPESEGCSSSSKKRKRESEDSGSAAGKRKKEVTPPPGNDEVVTGPSEAAPTSTQPEGRRSEKTAADEDDGETNAGNGGKERWTGGSASFFEPLWPRRDSFEEESVDRTVINFEAIGFTVLQYPPRNQLFKGPAGRRPPRKLLFPSTENRIEEIS
ncbi:hypothetical protein V2A60_000085 [Cordyceps javanica]|uniref:Uncharacterized protein n=1 Tax=Cordyceps javanica TaxID=43265 RepID=A0A545V6G8_9HYPO|nr:hypothetical protein IF1G_04533 [Cordyceps javanica]TQW08535.1 hypothetical protein IF2G_04411 [Cordyceps javanica]